MRASDEVTRTEAELRETCRSLLTGPGIGTLVAAQILMSWSHAGRCRDEAGFARLGGVGAPQATTGQCQVLTRVRVQPGRVFELKHSSCDANVRISDDVRGLPARARANISP
ncbi:transposase [Microbacterium sp. 2C]|uniref:transposase n=1 Tax=Microbacterium paulum TaxID=2707006 RepID=UPI0018C24B0C|nr:transposase [Microbacterium paulum]